MKRPLASAAFAAGLIAASVTATPVRADPPAMGFYEADVGIGTLPFVPGQTFSFVLPKSIPDDATQILVMAMFACSLVSGQIQDGQRVEWTIWTPIVNFRTKAAERASFQHLMWCAPGQFTTNQSMGWLPINETSRTVFAQLNTTGNIPWDSTSSIVKVVSYQ